MKKKAWVAFLCIAPLLLGIFLVAKANGNLIRGEYDLDKGNIVYVIQGKCNSEVYPSIVAVISESGLSLSTRFYDAPDDLNSQLDKAEVVRRCPLMKVGYPKLAASVVRNGADAHQNNWDHILPPQNAYSSNHFNERVIGWTAIDEEFLMVRGIGEGEFVLNALVIVNDRPIQHFVQIAAERKFEIVHSLPEPVSGRNILLQNFYQYDPTYRSNTLIRFTNTERRSYKELLSLLGAFLVGVSLASVGSIISRTVLQEEGQ